jgi:D-xylose transport system permease protein
MTVSDVDARRTQRPVINVDPPPFRPWHDLRMRVHQGELGMIPVFVSLVLIAILFGSMQPDFLSPRNISNLLVQVAVTGTLAVGLVLVLLIGEIDLSVGSIMGTAAALLGVAVTTMHFPWWVGLLVAIGAGALIGTFQGLWIAIFRVPSFVVTLAGFLGWYGVQQAILGSQGTVNVFDPQIAWIATSYLPPVGGWIAGLICVLFVALSVWRSGTVRAITITGAAAVGVFGFVAVLNQFNGVPVVVVILITLIAVFDFVLMRTQFGLHVYAVGGNAEAARRGGISLVRVRTLVFMLAGALAGLAAIIAVSRNGAAGTLTGGGTQMLEAIAAAVIGGTSLFGGRGRVWAALFGGLVLVSVSNGIDLLGYPTDVKFIVAGAILLLAVTIDALSRRRARAA